MFIIRGTGLVETPKSKPHEHLEQKRGGNRKIKHNCILFITIQLDISSSYWLNILYNREPIYLVRHHVMFLESSLNIKHFNSFARLFGDYRGKNRRLEVWASETA